MRTGKRLSQINAMITDNYQDIWDCCCDHGLLGIELLKRKAASTIHFADISAPLIDKLELVLRQFFSSDDYLNLWQVHTIDVAKIPVRAGTPCNHNKAKQSKAEQLIIIAGVGGDLLIELVQSICNKNPNTTLEFILCPVHHNYKVRTALIDLNCSLVNECIVKENNRFYEIIHVTTSEYQESALPISSVGSTMWNFDNNEHQQYFAQRVNHYSKMQKNTNIDAEKIIQAYKSLKYETK
ncbi:tRNA (adenine(22)-N(1))-methyltransferase TrmK [Thalassotalea psychrophila]|uniref:tRNA (Adenine(22)-N(1))-methyltransferase TrmK n=1 Tax=Thalassotalea psychrophila TaxID=3065647 RepID=A0ABY9TWV7_9GAMM|nr:tRNA (adenine(22)-N(1))-methyltransferase TrmK [Colwelliaceae bacterium SQ149]